MVLGAWLDISRGRNGETRKTYSDVEKRRKGDVSLKAPARHINGASAHIIERRIVLV